MTLRRIRRRAAACGRRWREARMVARALASPRRPVLAHIIPTRRCNLACTYCNEFDAVSPPVPTEEMLRRIDRLADLGTLAVTLSGGEPLLHPEVDVLVRHIRRRGMLASLITNGYLLTAKVIERLNRAGLDQLQISIDNLVPDEVSKKSLKVLDRKLQLLAELAEFEVNINSVLGPGIHEPEGSLAVAARARALGHTYTVGILHDGHGQVRPLDERSRRVFDQILAMGAPFYLRARYRRFQKNLARGQPNAWHCGSGARYLYVCEDGLVHWCSQQRGYPAIPLERYGPEDLAREYGTRKPCAPYCTVSCVHQVAMLDYVRERPREALVQLLARDPERMGLGDLPAPFRLLAWLFLPGEGGRPRRLLARAGRRLLGADGG